MAYYYVKSGGTATGDAGRYASQQTGSFATIGASGYYDNIEDAIAATTTPTHGDFICVSDAHSHTYASSTTLAGPTTPSGTGVGVISVSDTNCDAYSRGAYEEAAGSTINLTWQGYLYVAGLDSYAENDNLFRLEQDLFFWDCSFSVDGATDKVVNITADCSVRFVNCTFNLNAAAADPLIFAGSCDARFTNCVFTTNASFASDIMDIGINDNVTVEFIGCDFSALSSSYFVEGSGWDAASNYPKRLKIRDCKLPSLTDWYRNAPDNQSHELIVHGSASSSGANEYQWLYLTGLGRAEENTGIYRTGSTAFDGTQKVSVKVSTAADASPTHPFAFEFPGRFVTLSSASTDTVTIYFLSATSLDDGDIFFDITYSDGTNTHTPNYVPSVINQFDVFRTAGSLDTNTESWNGYTSQNRYEVSLDTSGDPGADGPTIIRCYVTRASTDIYICPTIGLS